LLMLVGSFSLLASCGYHLRGADRIEMPPFLAVLQLKLEGNRMEYNPLLADMKDALRTRTNARIEESGDAPRLVLFDEQADRQMLSVTEIGKVDEYLLKYEVSFRVVDKDNQVLSAPQTVKVRRDHQFNRLAVLAKEREQQELHREMQRDAVNQIVRRLARLTPVNNDADKR